MKLNIFIFLYFPLLFTASYVKAQFPDWTNYIASNVVSDIFIDQHVTWCATEGGGLVSISPKSNKGEFFYKTNSGIPSVQLSAIARDQQGQFWIGSLDKGLISFNGISQFVNFTAQNSPLPDNLIHCLMADDSGGIWIGTGNGIAYLYNMTWIVDTSSFFSSVRDILIDDSGSVWFACKGDGIARFSGGIWTFFDKFNTGISELNRAFDLTIDTSGRIYCLCNMSPSNPTSPAALAVYDGTSWDTVVFPPSSCVKIEDLYAVEFDDDGYLWFAGRYYNTACTQYGYYSSGTTYFINNDELHSNPYLNNVVSAIKHDPDGRIWYLAEGGLSYYDKISGTCGSLTKSLISSIAGPYINDLKIRKYDQTVWAATGASSYFWTTGFTNDAGTGLSCFNGTWNNWSAYNAQLPAYTISSLAFNGPGGPWMTVFNSYAPPLVTNPSNIFYFDGVQFNDSTPAITGISANNGYLTLEHDDTGHIWAGTFGGRVYRSGGAQWNLQYDFSYLSLNANRINAMLFDKTGDHWFGTDANIVRVVNGNPGVYTNWMVPPFSGNTNAVEDIIQDGNLDIWILTSYQLIKFSHAIGWEVYTRFNSGLPATRYTSLAVDSAERMWISTMDSGVVCWDYINNPGNWTYYDIWNSGLTDNTVTHLAVDSGNNVWIGTARGGICVYKQNPVMGVDDPPATRDNKVGLTAYPNPFNGNTGIALHTCTDAEITLRIYDIFGRLVYEPDHARLQPGTREFRWEGTDQAGHPLPPGIYYCIASYPGSQSTIKLILSK